MSPATTAVTDLPVRLLMRWAPPVTPQTCVGDAAERLRAGAHRLLPVVEEGRLRGVITERSLARAFLLSPASDRERLRASSIAAWMDPTFETIGPECPGAVLWDAIAQSTTDTWVVREDDGTYLGVVATADLVEDLLRPGFVPTVGGMATLTGVYLTTGTVSAGQGPRALMTLGGLLFCLQFALLALFSRVAVLVPAVPAALTPLTSTLAGLAFFAAFLGAVRLSPAAGFHAAEHQVVHALERREPLLLDTVRQMPRVHPRCGTNFLAAGLLLGLGAPLSPWLGNGAYALAGIVALSYWRLLGGWLQRYVTTRPATDRQLEAAIHAARALQSAIARAGFTPARPGERLWKMGLLPVALGFLLAGVAVAALGWIVPPLGAWLHPLFKELLTV